MKNKLLPEFTKGLWNENPVLRLILGMCPTLAVTNTAINGLSMGLATSFVLISSSAIVSIFKRFIPSQVRIATFTVIIATFVTVADLFLKANFPVISRALGAFVPLIVVNCIILGRCEIFASKNPVGRSIIDAFGMGCGFILALVILGSIREILGFGSLFNIQLLEDIHFRNWIIMILPPGAFISLGFLIALMNLISKKRIK